MRTENWLTKSRPLTVECWNGSSTNRLFWQFFSVSISLTYHPPSPSPNPLPPALPIPPAGLNILKVNFLWRDSPTLQAFIYEDLLYQPIIDYAKVKTINVYFSWITKKKNLHCYSFRLFYYHFRLCLFDWLWLSFTTLSANVSFLLSPFFSLLFQFIILLINFREWAILIQRLTRSLIHLTIVQSRWITIWYIIFPR